ncbi:hypothetical protein [Spongiactinospora sp. TRM90649]|uniref:hypothetical protein n=1 Tax=Spongiactinospora sp. TRM90649 TaxID=3031114 RepID=UPI0023F9694C|nr:hypothetical protein [Spongiactinospora sp. TRM90649]MDF5754131.1 hypothetical protein [Spongiactinospora sp. TRM90649]
MISVAVTGHRGLPPATARLVDGALREVLAGRAAGAALTGVSCLADGVDQLFARAVLDLGGRLEVVVPVRGYREVLPPYVRAEYDRLLAAAARVERPAFDQPTPEAYMAASVAMLDRADELIAVWDGLPARGHGGTADVVAEARRRAMPVRVLWPNGATREEPGVMPPTDG